MQSSTAKTFVHGKEFFKGSVSSILSHWLYFLYKSNQGGEDEDTRCHHRIVMCRRECNCIWCSFGIYRVVRGGWQVWRKSAERGKNFNSRKQTKLIQLTLNKTAATYQALCSLAKVQRKVEMRCLKTWKWFPGIVISYRTQADLYTDLIYG